MTIATDKLDSLRSSVANPVATDAQACERFKVDSVKPAAVVEPANAKELTEVIAWARSHRAALLPATSGAYLPVGNPPTAADVGVSLARLSGVVHYDPDDLTLSVRAGTPLREIQALLSERKLFLPADPPYADRAALGGLLAVNASGPLRYAYGTWRDFVVGLEFVTGEGKPLKTGGRVVKNVAGYDLSKLMIGSLGTLGVLTQINFRVFPLPPQTATFAFGFEELASALRTSARIVHSAWQPSAIELLSPQATGLASMELLWPPRWWLLVSVGGVEAAIRRYEKDFQALAREVGTSAFSPLHDAQETALWSVLRGLLAGVREDHPAATIVKCTLPLTQLGGFLSKAQQVAARYQLTAAPTAQAGTGIAYIYILPPEGMSDPHRGMAQAATEMIHAGNNLGGRTSIPWCPTEVKRDVNPWGPIRDDFPLMQKLKAQFDPDRVLNPGRFLGGF